MLLFLKYQQQYLQVISVVDYWFRKKPTKFFDLKDLKKQEG